jgi:hypothetical protein
MDVHRASDRINHSINIHTIRTVLARADLTNAFSATLSPHIISLLEAIIIGTPLVTV